MGYVIWPDGPMGDWMQESARERFRQEELRKAGKFPRTAATRDCPNLERLAFLAEEFGEVSRHVVEESIDAARLDRTKLRKELVQVAALALAWLEGMEPS